MGLALDNARGWVVLVRGADEISHNLIHAGRKQMSRSPFEIEIVNGVVVITVKTDLDASCMNALGPALEEQMSDGPSRIVIAGISFVNSAALGVLLAYAGEILEEGGDVRFATASGAVYNVLDLIGARVFASLQEALDSFERSRFGDDDDAAPVLQ